MEFRLNAALLVILAVVWAHLTAAEPVAAFRGQDPGTTELARMEDELALRPDDPALARRLAESYLDLQRPGLVIATLRAANPTILEHPVVAHRLAQAYEASGRVLDALATSELALARCSRSLGTADSPSGTALPRFSCNTHQHAVLTMHRTALRHMASWGVSSPGIGPANEGRLRDGGTPSPNRARELALTSSPRVPCYTARMNVVFLGATKGMGQALARKMATRGDRCFLLGRDADALEECGRDLAVRGGEFVGHAPCDLEKTDTFGPALEKAWYALSTVDAVIVTAGLFATQEELEADASLAERLTRINFSNTVVFCEEARRRLLSAGGGTLCVFSSVAGERGRKPVVIYGASKAGLSSYLEGLDHKFRSEGLRVVTVKPGFVKTSMTEGLDPPPFAGEPDQVADIVLRAIDRGDPVVYAPGAWKLVMAVIRRLPRAVMRRVKF